MNSVNHRLTDATLLCELLDQPILVELSTVSPHGRPQSSVVWTERRGDKLVIMCSENSVKIRNIAQNPHVAVIAVDTDRLKNPGIPAYALMTGTAEIRPAEPDLPDRLAIAYGNPDGYPGTLPAFKTVHIDVRRVAGLGPLPGGALGGWAPGRAGSNAPAGD